TLFRSAVQSEGYTADAILMSDKPLKFRPGLDFPQPHRIVFRTGEQLASVRPECQAAGRAAVTGDGGKLFRRLHIPEHNVAIIEASRQGVSIWADGNRPGVGFISGVLVGEFTGFDVPLDHNAI